MVMWVKPEFHALLPTAGLLFKLHNVLPDFCLPASMYTKNIEVR